MKESDGSACDVWRWTLMSDPGSTSSVGSAHAQQLRELVGRAERQVSSLQARLKEEQQLHRFLAGLADSMSAAHDSEALRQLNAGSRQLELLATRDRAV